MSDEMKTAAACEMCGQESHDGQPCPPKAATPETPAEGDVAKAEEKAGDE